VRSKVAFSMSIAMSPDAVLSADLRDVSITACLVLG
jgi:uncharacterized lipoprotein YbaY